MSRTCKITDFRVPSSPSQCETALPFSSEVSSSGAKPPHEESGSSNFLTQTPWKPVGHGYWNNHTYVIQANALLRDKSTT